MGLFNLGEIEREMAVAWPDLGLSDPQTVRDLWRQKDLGTFDASLTATVPRHGVMLIRLTPTE